MILIDTHILLWIAENDARVSIANRKLLNEAAAHRELFLSPLSIWEIGLKHSRGRLALDRPLRQWVQQISTRIHLQLAPVTADIACECAELPAAFHGDPADRIIAATARVEGMLLVTEDKQLLSLAKRGFLRATSI